MQYIYYLEHLHASNLKQNVRLENYFDFVYNFLTINFL